MKLLTALKPVLWLYLTDEWKLGRGLVRPARILAATDNRSVETWWILQRYFLQYLLKRWVSDGWSLWLQNKRGDTSCMCQHYLRGKKLSSLEVTKKPTIQHIHQIQVGVKDVSKCMFLFWIGFIWSLWLLAFCYTVLLLYRCVHCSATQVQRLRGAADNIIPNMVMI